jgi:hypothetical protein
VPIAVPVNIIAFMRESDGKLLKEKADANAKGKQAIDAATTSRNKRFFENKPKFGTIQTRIFDGGETGLIPSKNDDADGNQRPSTPEWEKHLNYGLK